jgi:tRNA pseudouridine38-40 synthase
MAMVQRIALGLEYDGRAFCGWQTQPHGCAVQDHLEAALACVHGGAVDTVVAGRTDAGVHALAQVVHFDAIHPRPMQAWVRGVNSHLPQGMAVLWACAVAPDFHARYGALARRYRYVLLNHAVRPALLAGRVGWSHDELDQEAMRDAAARLVGTHDFSAFRAAACQARTPVRQLREATLTRAGAFLYFDFCANAFLHHQVRNMVGALLWVGQRRRPPSWIDELLASRDRTRAAATAAADGLYLAGVEYDARHALPGARRQTFSPLPECLETSLP